MQGAGHTGTNDQQNPLMAARDDSYKTIRGLALTQVIVGGLAILLGIIIAIICNKLDGDILPGIWGGVWICATGIIGIASTKNTSNLCVTATYMAFSIVCTVISFISTISFASAVTHYGTCDRSFLDLRCNSVQVTAGLGLFIPSLILMLIEFFVSIVAASYCCKNTNCCRNCSTPQQQPFIVIPQQQQYQVVASHQGQPVVGYASGYPPPVNYAVTSHPTTGYYQPQYSPYPQQAWVTTAPGQMVSQQNTGVMHVSSQGQPISAETNILYSSQPTAPPTYNSLPEKGIQ